MGLGLNRKRMKKKKRSCPLCKPHKMGGDNRWKPKEYGRMKADVQEIRTAGGPGGCGSQKAGQRRTDVINRQKIMDFSREVFLSANIIEKIPL